MKKQHKICIFVLIVLVLLAIAIYIYINQKPIINNQSIGMANPASTNCAKVGGNLTIEKRGDLGEYGLCYFDDNRACEEWALFRGDCPVGGVKTTGFDTIDQKYCAWIGGQTLAVVDSVCTLKNGMKCSTKDLYNGGSCVSN